MRNRSLYVIAHPPLVTYKVLILKVKIFAKKEQIKLKKVKYQ
jgi:hypothetical protein